MQPVGYQSRAETWISLDIKTDLQMTQMTLEKMATLGVNPTSLSSLPSPSLTLHRLQKFPSPDMEPLNAYPYCE